MRHWVWVALAGLALLAAPAFGADYPTNSNPAQPPRPGTLNYIQGAANLNGNTLNGQQVSSTAMNAGDVLTTGAGKAEVLLTPGIFLRVDSNSAVKMISPDLEATRIELKHGRAAVEVDQILPQNMIQIIDNGETVQLMKTGYYEFDATPPAVMVFKGEARVKAGVGIQVGEGKWGKVKGGHELALDPQVREKAVSFETHPTDDALYNWSGLRSHYLAEANQQIAGDYYEPGFYPGWYWNPYMYNYTYLGMDPFYSPFGWGFYPWNGFYGGGLGFYGGGPWWGGRGWYGGRDFDGDHDWRGGNVNPIWHGGRGWAGGHGFVGHATPEGHGFAGHGFSGGGHGGFSGGGFHGADGFGGGGGRR